MIATTTRGAPTRCFVCTSFNKAVSTEGSDIRVVSTESSNNRVVSTNGSDNRVVSTEGSDNRRLISLYQLHIAVRLSVVDGYLYQLQMAVHVCHEEICIFISFMKVVVCLSLKVHKTAVYKQLGISFLSLQPYVNRGQNR